MVQVIASPTILILFVIFSYRQLGRQVGIVVGACAATLIVGGIFWSPSLPKFGAGVILFIISARIIGLGFRFGLSHALPEKQARIMKRIPLTASFGLFVVLCTLVLCIFAEFIAPYGESEIIGDIWEPSSSLFLLGTDNLGRDMLSRLIFGARTTVIVAVSASVLSFSIGMIQSFSTAVVGGWLDQLLSRINDLLLAIPTLVFALVVLAALPQNTIVLILVMAVIDQTRVFRLGRAVAMDIVVLDFVEAARLRGEGWIWIVFKEVLPNVLTPLIAEFGLRFAYAILFLSSLSFLGLGIQPPQADWGSMVKDNKDGIIFLVPAALYPGLAIALLAVSVNMIVDWLLNRTASLKGGRG